MAEFTASPPLTPTPRSPLARLRVRAALAFAAVTSLVLLALQALASHEAGQATQLGLLEQAARQQGFVQQLGRHAALVAAARGPAREARSAALQALLAQPPGTPALQAPQAALQAWHDRHHGLLDAAHGLLRAAEAGPEEPLQRSAEAVQQAADDAGAALQGLLAGLQAHAQQQAQALQRTRLQAAAALLLLLALLTAAGVQRRARRLRQHDAEADAEIEVPVGKAQLAELQRLAMVAEQTTSAVLVTDRQDRIVWANRAFTEQAGWKLDEVRGRLPSELMHSPQADPDVLERVRRALASGQGVRDQWVSRMRDGRERWLDVDLRPMPDGRGGIAGYMSINTDITECMQQQAKLQTLWTLMPAAVLVRGPDGRIIEANPTATRLLGLSLAQMQGNEPLPAGWATVHDDGRPYPCSEYPGMRTLHDGVGIDNETLGVRLPGGQTRWLLASTAAQRNPQGQVCGVISSLIDITERRRLQERLVDNARTDALTKLPNRTIVMERLHKALHHVRHTPGYGFAVLFMDFDRFKRVNDTLGHSAGDELLRQIAQRLQQALRPGDAVARAQASDAVPEAGELQVAARLGGDEFVVVLERVSDAAAAAAVAQRLLQQLAEPYLIGNAPVLSSASIGVVLCAHDAAGGPPPELDAESVLRNADTAMYEAKRAGRGRWVMFDASMHERVVHALALENDLRRALRDDELFVVYQPLVDLATRRMTGVEALVRWRHPQRGLVAPAEFIGVAEECGLIDAVGQQVLRRSCAQYMRWQQELGDAAPARIAVNLSRAQLERAGLVDEVRSLLAEAGMSPGRLQLEVTESLAGQDEHVRTTLRELKNLGVQLALDDFGTGYSSLACLHQLPVDTVKVDRSFVQHAETVEYHRVLIEATIRVARTLGMTTVAEGIETEGQARLMQALECDRGQGYLFSRPLEADELARWARAHSHGDMA